VSFLDPSHCVIRHFPGAVFNPPCSREANVIQSFRKIVPSDTCQGIFGQRHPPFPACFESFRPTAFLQSPFVSLFFPLPLLVSINRERRFGNARIGFFLPTSDKPTASFLSLGDLVLTFSTFVQLFFFTSFNSRTIGVL